MRAVALLLGVAIALNAATSHAKRSLLELTREQKKKRTEDFERECRKQGRCNGCNLPGGGFEFPRPQDKVVPVQTRGGSPPWLCAVVQTVPREGDVRYLERTVRGLVEEIPDQLDAYGDEVHVVVANLRPGEHALFSSLQRHYEEQEPVHGLHFASIEPNRCDPARPADYEFVPDLSPEVQVRQQTRDAISTLLSVQKSCQHVMVMEDDFRICPGAMRSILGSIHKAYRREPRWNGMRISYGYNGIIMRGTDVGPFAEYLVRKQLNMPVDLLAAEWFVSAIPETKAYHDNGRRRFLVHSSNLLDHLGVVSTFAGRTARDFGGCGQALRVKSAYSKESFAMTCAARSELSPCNQLIPAGEELGVASQLLETDRDTRPLADDPRLLLAAANETCDAGCGRIRVPCSSSPAEWAKLHHCHMMREVAGCSGGCVALGTTAAAAVPTPALLTRPSDVATAARAALAAAGGDASSMEAAAAAVLGTDASEAGAPWQPQAWRANAARLMPWLTPAAEAVTTLEPHDAHLPPHAGVAELAAHSRLGSAQVCVVAASPKNVPCAGEPAQGGVRTACLCAPGPMAAKLQSSKEKHNK